MIRVFFVFGASWLITSLIGPAIGLHGIPAVFLFAGVCIVLTGGTNGRNDSQDGGE